MGEGLLALKQALLAFWATWFAVVFATNACNGLKAAGRLPPSWKFAAKNYEAVVQAISRYGPPPWLAAFLFVGVLAWQFACFVLFTWAALASISAGSIAFTPANAAFTAGILLWCAFMLADEVTLKYEFERTHELLLLALVASLLAVHLLPG